jgi:type IV pilus assembly protein PilY1
MSTADLNPDVNSVVSAAASYQGGVTQINTSPSACPKYAGSRNLDDLTWLAKNRNIKDFTEEPAATDPSINRKTITTYVVYNGVPSNDPGECNPDELLSKAAEKGCGTDPALGCYQRAENPAALQAALRRAFLQISGAAASGTAASVLATGEGSGANLIQALFYPEVTIGGTLVNWTGSMKNMWYFIDPRLGNSSIREDTLNDGILTLNNDNIVHFFFDSTDNLTKADLFADSDGDGVADSSTPSSTVYFENVKSIWEAGAKLWAKNPADRLIYTTTDGSTRVPLVAPLADDSPLIALLQAGTNRPLAERIINYTRGTDYNSQFCSSTVATACTQDSDCPGGETCIQYRNRTVTIGGVSNTLKLGDVINSTPRIASWVPLNTYYSTYKDLTYKQFTESSAYTNRGTVFVGANDGMLHAFKLGTLELFDEQFKKAQLSGTNLGDEQWAFIPNNVLPYLKYMADTSYCHLYYVDATPYIFDASFNLPTGCSGDYWDCAKTAESWRTVLIGSMRFGGACKNPADSDSSGVADSCTKDINNDGVIDNRDCVLTPASGTGYSSYFALDVTDPASPPQVLWEFSHPDLGFSTSGPAVVRLGDKTKNGRWFVVLGSGPTGPIDTATQQMMGYSDQNLKVFILDLQGPSSGAWTLNTDYWVKDSGIANAFSGSMINAPIDFEQNKKDDPSHYQDDALYFGYVKAADEPPTVWNVGGVMRLFTKNDMDNPANWALNRVIPTSDTNIGPVPSAVAKLQNYTTGDLYLFFGTGRFYFRAGDQIDDANIGRSIYGV